MTRQNEESLAEVLEFDLDEFKKIVVELAPKNEMVTTKKLFQALKKINIKKTLEECEKYMEVEFNGRKVPIEFFMTCMRKSLNPKEWSTLEVIKNKPVSHDTNVLEVVLPSKEHISGHNYCDYIIIRAKVDGKVISKNYTPISHPYKKQWLHLCIKKKEDGKMSKHLSSLKTNDMIECMGPFKQFDYKAREFRRIGMIVAGSGITAVFSIIENIRKDTTDRTKVTVIYCNKTERDILFLKELKEFSRDKRITVIHTISKSIEKSHYIKGRINKCLITTFCPRQSRRTLMMCCGPKGFNEKVNSMLKEMEYPNVVNFVA